MRPYFAIIEDSFREAMSSRVLWVLLAVNLLVLVCLVPFGYLEMSKVDLDQNDLGTFENRLVLMGRLSAGSKNPEPSPAKHIFSLLDEKPRQRILDFTADESQDSAAKEETPKVEPAKKAETEPKDDESKKTEGEKKADAEEPGKKDSDKAKAEKSKDDSAKKDQGRSGRRGGGGEDLIGDLPGILNKTLHKKEFYNEEAWKNVNLGEEAKELKKKGIDKLSTDELGRFNRLALEAAFRDSLEASARTTFTYTAFGNDIGNYVRFQSLDTRTKFDEDLMGWVRFLLAWFVGAIGIFISILVTSSIVPDTFDAGSLHLLLSKPLTRSRLFLAKFTGACIFTLISALLLLGGVTLLLGLRFGVWQPGFLVCIPIYVFVFAVYYSVSSFIGLAFRSPIISIAAAVLFWLVCFVLGFGPYWMRDTVLRQVRVARLIPVQDNVLVMSEVYRTRVWNAESKDWRDAYNNDGRDLLQIPNMFQRLIPFTILPPSGFFYDDTTQQMVSLETVVGPGGMGSRINYAKGPEYKQVDGPNAPLGTITLLPESGGKFIIVAQSGIYRGDTTKLQPGQSRSSMFGFNLGSAASFENVGPREQVTVDRPAQAALDSQTGQLVIYSRGQITTLERTSAGKFEVKKQSTISNLTETQKTDEGAAMVVGGGRLIIALQSGRLLVLDPNTHEVITDGSLQGNEQPRTLSISPDGKVAIALFHNGRLMISHSDIANGEFKTASVRGQGDISAAFIQDAQTIYIADRTQRVAKYKIADLTKESEFAPKLGWFDFTYRYIVAPLYYVFPKPGELEKTIRYVLDESPSQASNFAKHDLMSQPIQKTNPWSPVISSGIFMLVMLALSCFYIERQEY